MLVLHHQPIPCGCSWLDTMILDNSADFISLISSKPAIRAVINGHIHQSNQQDIGGISFISSPSTCFQFTPQTSQFSLDSCMPGYRRLTLNDDGSIETEVVRLADFDLNLEHTQSGY
jgi:Icc protein